MTETSLVCKACGSDSIPKGSNFCPNCGTNLRTRAADVPLAAAVPIEENEPPPPPSNPNASSDGFSAVTDEVSIPVSSVAIDDETTPSPNNTHSAAAAAAPSSSTATHPQDSAMQGATYWKHPTPAMLQQAADVDAMGGILFLTLNCKKGGKFTVPRTVHAGQILTGSKLDLSRADFVHPSTTIYAGAILGGFSLTVPRGVRVEARGLGILGAIQGLSSQTVHAGQDDAPVVILSGVAILGGIKVKVNETVPPVRVIE